MIIGKFSLLYNLLWHWRHQTSIANGLIKIDKFHSFMDDLHSLKFMEFYGIYGILCEVMKFYGLYGILCDL